MICNKGLVKILPAPSTIVELSEPLTHHTAYLRQGGAEKAPHPAFVLLTLHITLASANPYNDTTPAIYRAYRPLKALNFWFSLKE